MWAGATRYDRIVDGNRELWVPEGYSASQPAACWKAKRDPVTGKTFFVNVAGLGKRWRLPDIHDPDDAAKLGWLGDGATVRKAPAPIPDVPEPLARPSAVTSALHRRESTPAALEHRSVSKGHGFAVGPEDAAARRGLGPGLGPDATADDLVRQHQSSTQLPDAGSIMDRVRAARADAAGAAVGAGGLQNPQGHHHQAAADHLDPLVAARYRRTSGAAGGFADPHSHGGGQTTNGGLRHDGHTSRESSHPAGHAAARRGSEPSPAGAGRYPNAHVDELREVDAVTRPGAVAALLRARAAQRGAAPLSTGAFARPPGLAALEALNGGAANAQQQNGQLPPTAGAGIDGAFPETTAAAQAPPVPVVEPLPRRPAPTGRFVHLAEDVKPAALMDYDDDVWNRPTKMEAAAQEQARRDIERQKLDDLNAQFAAEAHTRSQQLSVEEQVAIDEVLREQERPLYVPSSAQHRPGPTPGSGHPSHVGRSGSKSNQSPAVSSRHTPVASRSASAGSHLHPGGREKGKSPEQPLHSGVRYSGHPSAHGSGAFDSGDDSDDYVSPERKALEQQLQGISLSPGRTVAPPPPPLPHEGLHISTNARDTNGAEVSMEPTSPPGYHGATTQPGTPTTSTGQPDTTIAGGHAQTAEAAKQDAIDALELAHMRVMKESAERVANMVSSPLSATNVNPPSEGQHPLLDGAGGSGLFGDSAEARAALSASPHLGGHRGATAPAALEAAQQQLLADPMNPSSPMMLGYSGILGSSTLGGGTGIGGGGLAPPSMAADAHHPAVKTAVALAADDVAYHRREIERLRADLELKDRELAAKRLSDAERDRRDLQMRLKMMDALAAYRAQNATIADEEKALEQLHASAATAPFRDARLARTEGRRTSAPVPVGRPGVTIPSTMPSAYIDSDAEGY